MAIVFGASVACFGKNPYEPGTKVGTFHVTAKLAQSSCGSVPDPWAFDVQLDYEGSTLYWVQGDAPISGTLDAAATARLAAQLVSDVRAANPKTGLAACSIMRSDGLVVTLGDAAGKPTIDASVAKSFWGDLDYSFAPTDGSDCSDQTLSTNGDFAALPCEVRYELTGALATPQ